MFMFYRVKLEAMKNKYETLIISCWVVLIICLLIKLLGGNYFQIVCQNQTIIKVCNYIENSFLYYVFCFILYFFGTIFYFKAVLRQIKLRNKYLCIYVVVVVLWLLKLLLNKYICLTFGIEMLCLICIPTIFNRKKWWKYILCYMLTIAFQVITLITKNIGLKMVDTNFLIGIIYSIDYYIMIILFYLYATKSKRGEVKIWD